MKDMIEKLAYVYWYEHMSSHGFKLTPKQTELYEKVRHEIMDFGYEYFDKGGKL